MLGADGSRFMEFETDVACDLCDFFKKRVDFDDFFRKSLGFGDFDVNFGGFSIYYRYNKI